MIAIEELSTRERTKVLWVGQAPQKNTIEILEQLHFTVEHIPLPTSQFGDTVIAGLAGVIFMQADTKPSAFVDALKINVKHLLDHGCLVFILATPSGLESVKNKLTELKAPSCWPATSPKSEGYEVFYGLKLKPLKGNPLPQTPYVRVYRAETQPDGDVINMLVFHGPQYSPAPDVTGDVPEKFKITGPAADKISTHHRLMLRRSFHNCLELHLDDVPDAGRSGVEVYIAHATLKSPRGARDPIPARRQLPFFVKIGPRWKITPEWLNYEARVRHQIPFHLAPRLVSERCGVGAYTGIIVGDFVEDSESLGVCSRSGRASTPIGTLFDRTLRGWHSQASPQDNKLLYVELRKRIDGDVSEARMSIAKDIWPVKRTPLAIKDYLRQRPAEILLWGPIHGDLHTDNIRVRGSDAILIDFCSARDGPLLVDPAALEVSLAIRAPSNTDDFNREAWLRMMRSIFSKDALIKPPAIHDPTEPYAWIASCIRQVRLHALPMQRKDGQYAHVLAYCFLQAAIKDPKIKFKKDPHGHENFRRAVAYSLADSLLAIDWKITNESIAT